MSIISISVRRPITIFMITLIVSVLGWFSYSKLAVDLMPDISFPILTVITEYEGVSPYEIETLVTKPIEEVAASIESIDSLTSNSYEGRSIVRLRYKWGHNLDVAVNDLRSKLDQLKDILPTDAKQPVILKFDVNAIPILWVGVSGEMSRVKLRAFTEKVLKARFERIEGVAQAEIEGGLEREVHVNVNYNQLQAKNLTLKDVVTAIKNENVDVAIGDMNIKNKKYILRAQGKFKSVQEINNIVVKRINEISVKIKDIATVEDGIRDVKTFIRVNGVPALTLRMIKQAKSNTVKTAERIHKEIRRLQKDPILKERGVYIRTIRDTSIYVKRSISNVQSSALYGAFIAVLVLVIFLRNFRSTFIISLSMVVSVIATFIFIYGAKFTLNMMSFGGLALGIGMLVDNSVVVMENIYRHRIDTLNSIEASLKGTSEVANAIIVSTLTTIVVFLPLFFFEGITGIMFSQLAYMVSFSLICSLFVALTMIPAFSSRFLHIFQQDKRHKLFQTLEKTMVLILDTIEKDFISFLNICLKHNKITISIFASIFALSIFLVRFIGFDFMTDTDEGEIRINGDMSAGINIETTGKKFFEIESILLKDFKNVIDVIYTRVGQSGYRRQQENAGYMDIYLKDLEIRKIGVKQIVKQMQNRLKSIKHIRLRIRESSFFLFRIMSGGEDRVNLEIMGHDLIKGDLLAKDIMSRLRKIKGFTYLRNSRELGSPELTISVDREKARSMGLSVNDIGKYLQTAVLGEVASRYTDGEYEYDIRVRINQDQINSIKNIEGLSYPINEKEKILFKNLIKIKRDIGPIVIERLNQQRVIYIQGGVAGRDTQTMLNEIKRALSDIDFNKKYENFYINYGGIFEEQTKAYSELMTGLILAVCLVYMVMAAQFESFKAPFVIMFTVPLAFTGVILIFYLSGKTFDIQGFIGSIMLTGIVVNNSIILVDFIMQRHQGGGISLIDAIIDAGAKRLRPILMTTLTTICALIPLAIGIGEGSEMQISLAFAVIGGLSYSTLVSLLFIPCLYLLFFRNQDRIIEK